MRLLCFFLLCLSSFAVMADDVQPIRTLIDVRSNHSDGAHAFETLIALAKQRHIQALAFTEHDRTGIRIGLPTPMGILGPSLERPSLYTTGLKKFFADLADVRQQHPEMILFAATESLPAYTWHIQNGRLQLINADKHLIALGIEKPEQVEQLPSYQLRYASIDKPLAAGLWTVLGIIIAAMFWHSRIRWFLLVIFSFSLWIAWLMLMPQEDADKAWLAAAKQAGLVRIWTHPDTQSGQYSGPFGVQFITHEYGKRAFSAPYADGFTALYGDDDRNSELGGRWDRSLLAYWQHGAGEALWASAAGDFHVQGDADQMLGDYVMDVWAQQRNPQGLLEAIKQGHSVLWHSLPKHDVFLQSLFLQDQTGVTAMVGDEKTLTAPINLHMRFIDGQQFEQCDAQVIIDGFVKESLTCTQAKHGIQEELLLTPGKHVIRLQAQVDGSHMLANPFLIEVSD